MLLESMARKFATDKGFYSTLADNAWLPSQAAAITSRACVRSVSSVSDLSKKWGGGSRVDKTRVDRIRPARRPTYDFFNVRRNPRPGEGGSFPSRRWSPLSIEPSPSHQHHLVSTFYHFQTPFPLFNGSYIVFTGWGHFPMSTPLATPLWPIKENMNFI